MNSEMGKYRPVFFAKGYSATHMINFLKGYSYDIFKMFVNQLGMTMFGLVLSMATNTNDTLFIISSVFSIVFYLVLLYTMTWDIGYAEKIRIEGKRMKYHPEKGFVLSLCANILNLLLGIIITISYYCATTLIPAAEGSAIMVPGAPESVVNIYGIARSIATLLEGMYGGVINCLFVNKPWVFILIVFPAVITCGIAYIMGVKGRRITRMVGPDNSKE